MTLDTIRSGLIEGCLIGGGYSHLVTAGVVVTFDQKSNRSTITMDQDALDELLRIATPAADGPCVGCPIGDW